MAPEIETAPHEEPAVRTKRVLAFVFGFLGFVAILYGGLAGYYHLITSGRKTTETLRDFPLPRLQPNPTQDYVDFRTAQTRQLEGYDWVDRSKGLVHVPIERAMALVAARGAAAYDPPDGSARPQLSTAAPLDGAPRAVPQPFSAPYGAVH